MIGVGHRVRYSIAIGIILEFLGPSKRYRNNVGLMIFGSPFDCLDNKELSMKMSLLCGVVSNLPLPSVSGILTGHLVAQNLCTLSALRIYLQMVQVP
jgi:hypothetical protein